MASIENWKQTHDHNKSVRWKHRHRKADIGVTGLSSRGNHVPFKQADKVSVLAYATSPEGHANDINLVKREFPTKKAGVEFARNWMRNNPRIPKAEERSEIGKKTVRANSPHNM